MGNIPVYMTFAALLAKLRLEAGVQQSDLAKLINTTQQTVSRWELGFSRPRDKQMSMLAAALNADINEFLAAAGYRPYTVVITSFDQPFPIDALKPDSFERFCLYFLEMLFKKNGATVHRAGELGHTQEGLDVEATFPNKTVYTFQCKRVQQFGPKDVHTAVAKHTRKAKKKFLLLSRIASPQSREAIKMHANWDIWDKEDISREIRQNLSKEEQKKLVDVFFPGQRLALLGETEAGPWQTAEDFFEPFMAVGGAFSHRWKLVGNTQETQDVVTALSDTKKSVVFLVGAGGAGKTRVLKEAVKEYQTRHKAVLVRFLSPRCELNRKNLEDLGLGQKLLVIDDAHDENSLQLLFQHAATPSNNTKLLLAFRPYGRDLIKTQAGNFALTEDRVSEIRLNPLDLAQATELAAQVLKEFGGPESAARLIARFTLGCPLAMVIGAQIVAKGNIDHLELTKNEDSFRDTIFAKFQDIIAGNIGNKGDEESIRKLLKIIALLQPFHPEDKSIAALVEKTEGVRVYEVNRLMLLLANAGVLFKRGSKFRLSPDLLADFIVEESCIGHNGTSTGFAEQLFDAADERHIEHILVNLGKLDWRLANGEPGNSRLLEGIWSKLKPSSEYSDPHVHAVTAVAYYQPERALKFAERLILEGKYLIDLPDLIKYAAYNLEHLTRACELLWQLGKSDKRELSQNPGHAIRILAELCKVKPNKPREYNEKVVDFALSLLEQEDSWNLVYTPFDILKSIVKTEGEETEWIGRRLNIQRFTINLDFVYELRNKVIDTTITLLSHKNTKIAVLAARFLQETVRYPMSGNAGKDWAKEFAKTFGKIERVTKEEALDPLVLIEIARSVFWHVHFSSTKTKAAAQRIIASLPDSFEFRTTLALVDGYGRLIKRINHEQWELERNKRLDTIVTDLFSVYPDAECLRDFIEKRIAHIEDNFGRGDWTPRFLYERLTHSSLSFSQATVENAVSNCTSKTIKFSDIALSKLLCEDHAKGLDFARRFLETGSRDLLAAVGFGYSRLDLTRVILGEKDILILRKVLASTDELVVMSGIDVIRNVARKNHRHAIDLLMCVDIGMSDRIADDVLIIINDDDIFAILEEKDVEYILEKLKELSELNGHWIETFLSKASVDHSWRTARFFMDRVERAADSQNWEYRPCNYGPYCNVPLQFRKSPEFGSILQHVANWMKTRDEEDDYLFLLRAAELFDSMFRPFDIELIGFLQEWTTVATPADMRIISHILKEAPASFAFEHRPFVIRFLEKAQQYGKELLDHAINALIGSATSGIRNGVAGKPFEQDVQLKEYAEIALQETPRFSPAYRLYDNLKQHAEQSVEWSLRVVEQFDEE